MEIKLRSVVRLNDMMLKTLMSEVHFTKVNYKYFVPVLTVNTPQLRTKEKSVNTLEQRSGSSL